MANMLRHKETGELFIYTDLLSRLDVLELVVDDPIAAIIKEVGVAPVEELEVVTDEGVSPIDELEAALGDTFKPPAPKKRKGA